MKLLNLGCGQRFHPDWVNVDFHSAAPNVVACNLAQGIPFPDEFFDVVYHSHLLEHFPKRYAPVFLGACFRILKPGGIIRVVVPDLEQLARMYLELLEKALRGDEESQKRYEWIVIEMLDQMVRTQSGGDMLEYWKQNPMPAENFVIQRVGSEVLKTLDALRHTSNSIAEQKTNEHMLFDTQEPTPIGVFRMSGEVHQWMYDRYSLSLLLQDAGFQQIQTCRASESRISNFNQYLLDIESEGSVRKPDSLFVEATKP